MMDGRRKTQISNGAGWLVAAALATSGAFFAGWSWNSTQAETLPPLFHEAPSINKTKTRAPSQISTAVPVQVHVAGAVRKPAVITLNKGARVLDAVRAAGGVRSDADIHALNLAAKIEDGQQIRIPTRSEKLTEVTPATANAPASPGESARDKKPLPTRIIDINRASSDELQSLPGIGPALAQRIIEYRNRKGRFESLNDLDQVKGFGPKKLEALRRWIRFS